MQQTQATSDLLRAEERRLKRIREFRRARRELRELERRIREGRYDEAEDE